MPQEAMKLLASTSEIASTESPLANVFKKSKLQQKKIVCWLGSQKNQKVYYFSSQESPKRSKTKPKEI